MAFIRLYLWILIFGYELYSIDSQPLNYTNNYTNFSTNNILNSLQSSEKNSLQKERWKRSNSQEQGTNHNNIFDPSRGGLTCNLCVVVDEQFVRAYNLDSPEAVVSHIRRLIDRISWIFRNIDWNNDGKPDNIGFEVTSLVRGWNPYPYESIADYEYPKPSLQLLGEFAKLDFRSCCLGVGFTNRPFEKKQVGISFIASNNLLGGICDFRIPAPPLTSSNVALISAKGLKGSQMSIKDMGSVLLHELGHAFGIVKHDADHERITECSGFDANGNVPNDYRSESVDPPNGRFIMWGQDIQGIKIPKANNLNFSPCSRAYVSDVLRQPGRASCLLPSETTFFCGNGIVEYPEECDCGNEVSCAMDGCCGPRGSSAPCQLFKGIPVDKCRLLAKEKKSTKNNANTPQYIPTSANYFTFLSICFMYWIVV